VPSLLYRISGSLSCPLCDSSCPLLPFLHCLTHPVLYCHFSMRFFLVKCLVNTIQKTMARVFFWSVVYVENTSSLYERVIWKNNWIYGSKSLTQNAQISLYELVILTLSLPCFTHTVFDFNICDMHIETELETKFSIC